MIRLEMLREEKDEFHTVGLYLLVPETYFVLTRLDTVPELVNDYLISFPMYEGKKKLHLTHLGIFPDVEYTGVVTKLTSPLEVHNGGVVSFAAHSIVMTMITPDKIGITVIKGGS